MLSRLHINFLLLFSLCLFLHTFPFYCHAIDFTEEEQDFINNSPAIRIHNETDWPPFNFYENGKAQGLSIDVIKRVAEITGLRIEFITGPSWAEFIRMIEEDQLDVMLNIIDLPERKELFKFSTPYAKSLSGIFTTNDKRHDFFSFDDLAGMTVAIPAGFDLEISLPLHHPEVKLLPVRDILECIEAIHSGKADAFMEEIGVVDYITSQQMVSDVRLAFQVNEEAFISNLTIGVKKDRQLLSSILQKGLNNLSGDELNSIRKKWLLEVHEIYERSMVNLSVEEKKLLFLNNRVKICVDPSWPPLDFIDEEGKHSGLSADLINTISSRAGVELLLVPTTTWQQSLDYIREGHCQVIPLMNETEEAAKYMDFSQPYFNFATVIATRNEASFIGDYSDLYGKKVALQACFFITEYVKENHPQINIIEVENTREALKLVNEQKAYATIDGLPTIVNTIEALALENIKIVGSVPQENSMKLGVRKDTPLLLSIFSKGIASLTEKEKIGLYRKWFDIEVSNQFFNKGLIIKTAVLTVLILLFLLWRQFTLSKYTRQLRVLNEKLRYTSTVDHLTKIFNRRSIEKQLAGEVERAQLTERPLTIVIFDIDHFKKINDAYGHISGDQVLEELASLVKSSIRRSDHFGRWGGEEFLIILSDTKQSDAEKMIDKLKHSIGKHNFSIDQSVTASFGVGQYEAGETVTNLLSRVDDCLYRAKNEGRDAIVTASDGVV